jgi:hypothetical protein
MQQILLNSKKEESINACNIDESQKDYAVIPLELSQELAGQVIYHLSHAPNPHLYEILKQAKLYVQSIRAVVACEFKDVIN